MVEVRAHAPEQKMLKQTKYTSTIQQSVNYKLMIVGAPQSNQEVGKNTLWLHTIVMQMQFYKLPLQQDQNKTEFQPKTKS